ncbi:hypothetical protein L7F22_065265 [Adiantum nelumboides]|nr:hypothetical protein [Adiantum nelumboides]
MAFNFAYSASTKLAIPHFLIHDPTLPSLSRRCQQQQQQRRAYVPLACSNLNGPVDTSPGTINYTGGGAHVLTDTVEAATQSLANDLVNRLPLTGGAFDFSGATKPLIREPLKKAKHVVLVRHGLSTWNEDSRIQGSSDLSVLSEQGAMQAFKCKKALENMKFDQCFASPISRAKSMAELIWEGRAEPLVFLDTLKEAHLHFLEGMRNADAKVQFPEIYRAWREEPASFHIEGVYPVVELWDRARKAWEEILSAEGQSVLVVTHKSILRALICRALGMGPRRFRVVDINNGGICKFKINEKGEPLLQSLNMTAHLHVDSLRY